MLTHLSLWSPLLFHYGEYPSKSISERHAFCADMSVSLQLVKEVSAAAGIAGTQKPKCPSAIELNTHGEGIFRTGIDWALRSY